MSLTLKIIITKIININENMFSLKDIDNIPSCIKLLFYNFLTRSQSTKQSFLNFFYETINNDFLINNFLNIDNTNKFISLFCKIKKIYSSLNKFSYIYKYKKSKIVVKNDMDLNEINENDKNIICIYHANSKYIFRITDLIKIINTSLTHDYNFFANPLSIKNPFNNIAFKKSDLYNIYFFINFNTKFYSELFFKFFKVNFDLTIFLQKYEYLLRNYSIENYINNSPKNILKKEIMTMINKYNKLFLKDKDKILIDKDFPNDKLIKIMKPYLLLYINSSFSLIPQVKEYSTNLLKYKLYKFKKFNPLFGRKIIILKNIYKIIPNTSNPFYKKSVFSHFEYNDKYIPFNDNNNNFLETHLEFTNIHHLDLEQYQYMDINQNQVEYIFEYIEDNESNNSTDEDQQDNNVNNNEDGITVEDDEEVQYDDHEYEDEEDDEEVHDEESIS